ncbi:MAG: ComEC/Rec2 family competence protein [Bacteroidota bacterium]
MKFIQFFVVKISLCFALGIAIGELTGISLFFLLKTFGLTTLLLLVVWIRDRKRLRPGWHFGILLFTTIFLLGWIHCEAQRPAYKAHFFSQHSITADQQILHLKITDLLKSTDYYDQYYASVVQLDEQKTTGALLVRISKKTQVPQFEVDDLLLVFGVPERIPGPLNPHTFDYRKHLHYQGIYYRLTLSSTNIVDCKTGRRTIKGIAHQTRSHIVEKLSQQPLGAEERSIISALLLGDKTQVNKDLKSQYAEAGVLHILAVSGLHVGILFIIFTRVLSPLDRIPHGGTFRVLLVITLLWGFAFLAGLSPSVVRAVTMFSLFALAQLLKRPSHPHNTLFLAFLILLIANPFWLFHVGFQFSFLAVFFIIWLHPMIYGWYVPKFRIDRRLWEIGSVSIAAQMGIAPLSIYYFHQFPGLFFVSNLVILPFLAILLSMGMFAIVLSVFDALPTFLAIGYHQMIGLLNRFVAWIARQESFLIQEISCSAPLMIVSYVALVTLVLFLKNRRPGRLRSLLAALSLVLAIWIYERWEQRSESLIVFHKYDSTMIGHRSGSKFRLFSSEALAAKEYPVRDYRIGQDISQVQSAPLPDVFAFGGCTFLRIDSTAAFVSEEIEVLLLTQNAKVHLDRVIDQLKPTIIIADGSNAPWTTARWKATSDRRKVRFHNTKEHGAFVMDKNSTYDVRN